MAQYYSICKVKLKKKSFGFFFFLNRAILFVQWQINIHIFFWKIIGHVLHGDTEIFIQCYPVALNILFSA